MAFRARKAFGSFEKRAPDQRCIFLCLFLIILKVNYDDQLNMNINSYLLFMAGHRDDASETYRA